MKIETTHTDDHQVKINAEFDPEVFAGYKKRAARKIAKQTKIPGFRPGKAPYDIILRFVGEGSIQEEAIELLIDEEYAKILEEASVTPSGPGSLEEIVSIDPPKFTFVVPLEPEVDLGEYKEIRLPYEPEEATEDDVEDFLKRMQRNYATAEPVERPVEKGDLVYFKVSGIDKKAKEEENAEVLKETPSQIIVGDEEKENDWPYKGFEDELIGMSEEEEKKVSHKFAKNAEQEDFQGKTVEFTFRVESIKTLQLPELNDNFAKTMGAFETIEDLKKAVFEQLEQQKKEEYDEKYYTELLEKIADQATVKYPPQMVEEEIKHILHQVEHDLSHQNLDLETYFKLMNTDREKYIEENVRPAAEKRLVNSLIIDKLGQTEKVEIGREDVEGIMNDTVQMLQNSPDVREKKSKVTNEMVNNVAYNAMSRLYNQRTLERIKAIANGELEKESEPAEETGAEETETSEAQQKEQPEADNAEQEQDKE